RFDRRVRHRAVEARNEAEDLFDLPLAPLAAVARGPRSARPRALALAVASPRHRTAALGPRRALTVVLAALAGAFACPRHRAPLPSWMRRPRRSAFVGPAAALSIRARSRARIESAARILLLQSGMRSRPAGHAISTPVGPSTVRSTLISTRRFALR